MRFLLCVMTFTSPLLSHYLLSHIGGFESWSGVCIYLPSLDLLSNTGPCFYGGVGRSRGHGLGLDLVY